MAIACGGASPGNYLKWMEGDDGGEREREGAREKCGKASQVGRLTVSNEEGGEFEQKMDPTVV